jgi:hypothetical protein
VKNFFEQIVQAKSQGIIVQQFVFVGGEFKFKIQFRIVHTVQRLPSVRCIQHTGVGGVDHDKGTGVQIGQIRFWISNNVQPCQIIPGIGHGFNVAIMAGNALHLFPIEASFITDPTGQTFVRDDRF